MVPTDFLQKWAAASDHGRPSPTSPQLSRGVDHSRHLLVANRARLKERGLDLGVWHVSHPTNSVDSFCSTYRSSDTTTPKKDVRLFHPFLPAAPVAASRRRMLLDLTCSGALLNSWHVDDFFLLARP